MVSPPYEGNSSRRAVRQSSAAVLAGALRRMHLANFPTVQYVILDKEDLDQIQIESTKILDLTTFVQ
jgi:hypothetical protein